MFNEMVEAIDLLYFLADKHQNSRRRGKKWNPKIDYLFDEVSFEISLLDSYAELNVRGLFSTPPR